MPNVKNDLIILQNGIKTYRHEEKILDQKTKKLYLNSVENFAHYIDIHQEKLSSISEAYKLYAELLNRLYSKNTSATYLNGINKVFWWLNEKDLLKNLDIAFLSSRKDIKNIVAAKSDKISFEITKKLLNFKEYGIEDKRDKIILRLLAEYNLSPFQIVSIDVFDLFYENNKTKIHIITKARKEKIKYIIVSSDFQKKLSEFLSEKLKYSVSENNLAKSQALFTSFSKRNANQRISEKTISRILKQRAIQVGLEDLAIDINKIKGVLAVSN
jgi:hypothetical protein